MSALTPSILILAADPVIWSFHFWKVRTGNILPPFDNDATPANTHLESWQLMLIRKFAHRLHAIPTFDDRVDYIRRALNSSSKIRHAPEAWNTWASARLPSWNLQSDVEDTLLHFGRHPSQMRSISMTTHLVSHHVAASLHYLNLFPSSSIKDNYLLALAPYVAEQLFGDDAFINPMESNPFIKYDLNRFIVTLLPFVWNSAVASEL
ncbi:hypothetical protein EDB85DRAFT_2153917 [Lactarius pseudohatsudake]|nr:hypothetical protein EDB85DRAFT_2153917 [Lactarius pseudohatsudake]